MKRVIALLLAIAMVLMPFKELKAFHGEERVRVIVEVQEFGNSGIRGSGTFSVGRDERGVTQSLIMSAKRVAPDIEIKNEFNRVLTGFSAEVSEFEINRLKNIPGIKVSVANIYKVAENYGNYDEIFNNLSTSGLKGEGTLVGVIDSGVDPTHSDMSLSDDSQSKLNQSNVPYIGYGKYFSQKIPFGYNYADRNNEIRDTNSEVAGFMHGMHVAGIIGANGLKKGVAPETQILAMKVFSNYPGSQGAYEDDIIKAIDDCVKLGADVINMSLGGKAGFYNPDNPEERAIQAAINQGVIVVTSAGNSTYSQYPSYYSKITDDSITGSPGLSPEIITVASSEDNYIKTESFSLMVEGVEVKKVPYSSAAIEPKTVIKGDEEIIFAGFGAKKDYEGLDAKGKIVFAERGNKITFKEKAQNAILNGAKAVVVYNNKDAEDPESLVDMSLEGANQIPALFIKNSDGLEIKKYFDEKKKINIIFKGDFGETPNPRGGEMSEFTSFGPTPDLRLKPDLTAPGGMIWSTLNDGNYGNMSGTSMAAPYVAGAAALLKQKFNMENSKLQGRDVAKEVKMRLSSTATPVLDGVIPASPRRQGVGLIDVGKALDTDVLIESEDGNTQVSLGDFTGNKTFNLKLKNYSERPISYKVSENLKVLTNQKEDIIVEDTNEIPEKIAGDIILEGASIICDKSEITIAPRGTEYVNFTIDMGNADIGQYVEGFVRFIPNDSINPEIGTAYFGYYGDWSKLPILDEMRWENPIYGYQSVYLRNNNLNVDMGTSTDENGRMKVDPEKLAMTVNKPKYDSIIANNYVVPNIVPLRNIRYGMIELVDKDYKTVKKIAEYEYISKYIRGTDIQPGLTDNAWIFDGTIYNPLTGQNENLPEGQYYFKISNRADFKNSSYQTVYMPIKIDNTPPVMEDITMDKREVDPWGMGEFQTEYAIKLKARDEFSGIKGFYLINRSNTADLKYYDDSSISGIDFMNNVEKDGEFYTLRIDSLAEANQDYDLAAEDYAGNLTYYTLFLGESGIKILSPKNGEKFDANFVKVEFEIPEEILNEASDVFAMTDMDLSTVKKLKKTDKEFTFFNLSKGKHRLTIGTTDEKGQSKDMNSVEVEILAGDSIVTFDNESLKDGQAVNANSGIISGFLSTSPISFKINGEEISIDNDRHFKKEIALQEGRNVITLRYETQDGVKEYSMTVFADTLAPEIILHSPRLNEFGGIAIDGNEVVLEGEVMDNSGFKFFVNGGLELDRTSTVPSPTRENFSVRVPLREGLNKIEVVAEDTLKNITREVYLVDANTSEVFDYFENYYKFPETLISDPLHEFTVKFNQNIDTASVNEENIKVLDENFNELNLIDLEVLGGDEVKIIPMLRYEFGRTYYIVVKNITTPDGGILSQDVVMAFRVMP